MIVEPSKIKKELLLKKKNNKKGIMSMDDKIIIYPFLFYSPYFDEHKVYNLFLKLYNNLDGRKIECSTEEVSLAENIIKHNVDIKTGIKKYSGLIDEFIEDKNTKIKYVFTPCAENEFAIFYKEGKYYYCIITSVSSSVEGEYFIGYEIHEIKGKIPDFDLPKLTAYDEHNNCVGTL